MIFHLDFRGAVVTLSTAGVVPAMDRLAEDCPVSLAVSLHAVRDAVRDELVPLNRKYPIAVLLDACRRFLRNDSRRRITFEYVMLAGVNDSLDDARRLVSLLQGIPSKMNLIPFNPVPGVKYSCSDADTIDRFREQLISGGLTTITRKTRGADIAAACGQLAGDVLDRTQRKRPASVGRHPEDETPWNPTACVDHGRMCPAVGGRARVGRKPAGRVVHPAGA